MTLVAQPHLLAAETLISLDSASQFYPWYAFMGESLRSGQIPGWNPATFSGAPFAANPLSGWTYLPAVLLFTMLPLAPAAKAYLLFHPLLAAWSTYALARALGLRRLGALVAALAYGNSGFLQIQNSCCFAFASVYAWLPVVLFGAEGAIRSTRWTTRAAWWGLAALAFSQIVAAWLGQGTYYAALIIGGYIAGGTLFVPPASISPGLWVRIGRFVQHEAAIFSLGAAVAAAGLLPRVEFISLSNLAGGYAEAAGRVGGLRPEQWVFLVLPGMWYVGATVLMLAAAAPLLVRRRVGRTVWYFGATSLLALILTDTFETPLDQILYRLLPGFEHLHPHAPERILTVAYLGPALLAGATISVFTKRLTESTWWKWRVSRSAMLSIRAAAVALILVVVTLDLGVAGAYARGARSPRDPLDGIATLAPVDLATFYQTSGAASFNAYWPPMHQREVIAAGGGTLTDTLHLVWASITVSLMFAYIAFGAAALGKRFRWYSIATILLLLTFGLLTIPVVGGISTGQPTPWAGVIERISIFMDVQWVVVLSIALLRREPTALAGSDHIGYLREPAHLAT